MELLKYPFDAKLLFRKKLALKRELAAKSGLVVSSMEVPMEVLDDVRRVSSMEVPHGSSDPLTLLRG